MKDKDVRIGMKVVPHDKTVCNLGGLETSNEWKKAKKQGFLYVVGKEDDFYILSINKNEFSGDFFNACDFEPYIDTDLMAEQLSKAIDNLKDTLSLIDFVAKNKDTFEKLVEESKEEKLEKEIEEALDEYINKECSFSLQTCFRAGFLAGRESK